MVSYQTAAAALVLGLIYIGNLPTIATESSNSTLVASFDRGDSECEGTCSCNLIPLSCCEQQGNGGCCGNIAGGIDLLQCGAVPVQDVDVAAVIGVILDDVSLCDSSTNCKKGACILDLNNILASDKSNMYCCTGYNKEKAAYTCKNSKDKDTLLQCSSKGNTSTYRGGNSTSSPDVVEGSCCTKNMCNSFSG